jgi:hypothetical protein
VLVKIGRRAGSQGGAPRIVGAEQSAGFLHIEPAVGNVWRTLLAGCWCACAVDVRFLSVGDATAARPTAREPARRKLAATGKGKLGGRYQRLPVVVPCMLNEIVANVPTAPPRDGSWSSQRA